MQTVSIEDVERVRKQKVDASELAAERFRASFAAQSDLPPNERWRAHLEIQAGALMETARDVRLVAGARIHYDIMGRVVVPFIRRGEPLYRHFQIEKTPAAIFEYWMLISELSASPSWSLTKLVATKEEYDAALNRMKQPQLVRVLVVSFLPEAEVRADGTAMLEVTVHSRADEERIERRLLRLDEAQEFHYHSRELIAEGKGGVRVG